MSYFLLYRIIPTMLSIQLALLFSGAHFVEGAARFTITPPSVLYVGEGGDANFTWDYHVDDREGEFNVFSPKWIFYENATTSSGIDIAFDNQIRGWEWEIASTCPPRLLNPTRVRKESNATLVISNVTTADNGMYECRLILSGAPIRSKVQLIVTVPPQINVTGESNVAEYANMTLTCSAVGPPTPNVTWINDAGVVLEQGIQSAVLSITRITREQSGRIYACNATNNPNEDPVQKKKPVTVKVTPENATISNHIKTCPGDPVVLVCAANGYPPPTYYWYNPSNKTVGENKTGLESKITVEPVNGTWTCYITNGVGPGIYLKVQMTVHSETDEGCVPVITGCKTSQIVGFVLGFLIAVGIIAVIVVIIFKKKKDKRKWKEWTTLEKVLIPLGVIVAIIIIIVVIVFIVKCAK